MCSLWHLTSTESPLMLVVTSVLFLLWHANISAMKRAYWKGQTNLTWQPSWPGRLRCPDVCPLGWQRTRGRCYWSLLYWSRPILLTEAGSLCAGQPVQDYKTVSTNYTQTLLTAFCVCCCDDKRETIHLLPSQSDHVQRAVHEATCDHLLGVFCEHCVIYTVVGGHVLLKEWQKHTSEIWFLSVPFNKKKVIDADFMDENKGQGKEEIIMEWKNGLLQISASQTCHV